MVCLKKKKKIDKSVIGALFNFCVAAVKLSLRPHSQQVQKAVINLLCAPRSP